MTWSGCFPSEWNTHSRMQFNADRAGVARKRVGKGKLATYMHIARVTDTPPYLWMVGLTLIWLLIPQYLGATAIALIRTPDEIVVAADSKQTIDVFLPGFVSSRDVCKIHKIRDHFYFAVAGYRGVVDPLTGKAVDTFQGGISTVEH